MGWGGVGVLSRRLAHGVCTASRIIHATIVCERLNTDIPRVRGRLPEWSARDERGGGGIGQGWGGGERGGG